MSFDPDELFDDEALRDWVHAERPDLALAIEEVIAAIGPRGQAVQALVAIGFAAGVRKGKGL